MVLCAPRGIYVFSKSTKWTWTSGREGFESVMTTTGGLSELRSKIAVFLRSTTTNGDEDNDSHIFQMVECFSGTRG